VNFAQEDGGAKLRNDRKNPRVKTRIGFSPVLGIYKANKRHTSRSSPKMAFNISLKEEIRLDKKNRCFFMFGAEYMMHGVNFNSYYFYDDSLHLYDGDMNTKYKLVVQELNIPLLFKYSMQKETNALTTSYLFGGYCSRWLLGNKLNVNNGDEKYNQAVALRFKSPAFNATSNSFLCFGAGIQKNTLLTHNAVYAELQFRYGLSPLYFEKSFAPTNLYISNHFLLLTVGFKI
jgi:hypothetical protein